MKHFFKSSVFILATLTLAFTTQSCSSSKSISQANLEGYWVLKTLKGEAVDQVFKGSTPSLEFDFEKNMVNGSGGCNRYFGSYTLEGDVFKAPNLGSTMMMCIEENKETEFFQTLGSKDGLSIAVDSDVLTFKEKGNTVLEFNKGVKPADQPSVTVRNASIENIVGSWKVSKIKGKDASEVFGDNPATLVYTAEGAVSGNAGCNNYRSKATIDNGLITFGPLMSTKMACPRLEAEQAYSEILSKPIHATVKGDTLIFTQDDIVVLEYVKE